MPGALNTEWQSSWQKLRGVLFPLLIVASLLVIIAPLPPVMMDVLLACNVTASVLILLTTIYVSRPLEFSVFPALLLGTTLARLVLNVASTRLILTGGATQKTSAAGEVIEAFGNFVAGDRIAIGIIIFCILVAIQFLVITKGAGRISEVTARFFLDGMPGKQMAIDSDLAARAIDQNEARRRREEIAQQADFYGAMDGASKYVRGDAIAGIIITLINIVGGLYVGVVEYGMGIGEAAEVFTKLTIGDGLVTQIPAFLISMAAGLIVTRSSVDSDLPKDVVTQTFRHPEAMFLSAAFLGAMSFTGLPMIPLLTLSSGCGAVGYLLLKTRRHELTVKREEEAAPKEPPPREIVPEDRLPLELLMVQLGPGIVRLAQAERGGDLLDRVVQVRHQFAEELGILLPKIRVRDNTLLGINEYSIRIRDSEVLRGEVWPTHLLAINRGSARGELPGIATTEPLHGHPAYWIEQRLSDRAESQGYTLVEPGVIIMQQLGEVIRLHAGELLTRQHVHQLIGGLKDEERAPKLVEELTPERVPTSLIHQVLKNLLSERVPIRDLETILQTIADNADRIQNLAILTEYVRTALSRTICQRYRDLKRRIHLINLDPRLEEFLRQRMNFDKFGVTTELRPEEAEAIVDALKVELKKLTDLGLPPVVITTAPQIRAGLRQITSRTLPKLAVLCLNEISAETQITTRGQVGIECLRGVLAGQK